jgi:hypothetical protein
MTRHLVLALALLLAAPVHAESGVGRRGAPKVPRPSLLARAKAAWSVRKERLKATPLAQLAVGLGRGARDTWRTVKAHPVKTIGATLAVAGVSAGMAALSLPAQPICLGVCAVILAKGIAAGVPEVREGFRRKAADRYAILGENIVFPVLAFSAATGATFALGDLAAKLSTSSTARGLGSGIALGLHSVDDLPTISALMRVSDNAKKATPPSER